MSAIVTQVAYLRTDHHPDHARRFGPKERRHPSICTPCPACGVLFVAGDYTTLIVLGPGKDEEARRKCREGRYYNAVALEVHYACATGEQ